MKRALVAAVALIACREPDPTLARMLAQRRADPFEQEMRAPPLDTVPRDDDRDDEPPAVDDALLRAGEAHFAIACAPCHGRAGDGQSYVAARMTLRPPPSLVGAEAARFTRDRVYRAVTEGYGLMPSLAPQLDARARWAVVAYVDARRAKGSP